MIKLIKAPPHTAWSVDVKCTGVGNSMRGCGAVFNVERDDLRYYRGVEGNSWGSRDPEVVFKCPLCASSTDLSREKYPIDAAGLVEATPEWINRSWESLGKEKPMYRDKT